LIEGDEMHFSFLRYGQALHGNHDKCVEEGHARLIFVEMVRSRGVCVPSYVAAERTPNDFAGGDEMFRYRLGLLFQ